MTESEEASDLSQPRRRRRRSSGKSEPKEAGLITLIRGKAFGRALFALMCLLAAGFAWTSWSQVNAASESYGQVALGMKGEEVRYLLGQPSETAADGREWRYADSGRTLRVTFAPAGGVEAVSCREQDLTAPACPEILGNRIGNEAAAVKSELGQGEERFANGKAELSYPGIGAVFEHEKGKITAISLSASRRTASPWPIALRRLMP